MIFEWKKLMIIVRCSPSQREQPLKPSQNDH
jgi:hypothetical protein